MYTFAQFEQAWINAGGPVAAAPIAAAIAAAESSWGTNNQGDYYKGVGYTSFGPWQIHVLDTSGNPVNTQANGQPYDTGQLTNDLGYDATAAVAIYNQQGFNAWTTFKNGSYLAFLQPSSVSAPTASATGTTSAASTSASPVATAAGFAPVTLSSTTMTLILVATFVLLILALFAMGKKSAQATT